MEKEFNVEVKLSVEVRNRSVFAHLMFQNESGSSIYLNKQVTYYDGRVRNDYFRIKDSNGANVDYLGVMANCTRLPDEYIQLGPGETVTSTICLEKVYELNEGGKYNIQYYAYNPTLKGEQPQLMKMQSNKVKISYK
jgi:hypothetical protein